MYQDYIIVYLIIILYCIPLEDMNYYQQTKHDVLESLSTTEQTGLSTHQVEQLLLTYGKNELKQKAINSLPELKL